jgi:hypothetical protein
MGDEVEAPAIRPDQGKASPASALAHSKLQRHLHITGEVDSIPKDGAAGYGLSNQSWLHNFTYLDTKPEEIIAWTQSALDQDCRLIQFEPAWYFFNLPSGTFELGDSNQVSVGTQTGEAKESLKKLTRFLLEAKKNNSAIKEK